MTESSVFDFDEAERRFELVYGREPDFTNEDDLDLLELFVPEEYRAQWWRRVVAAEKARDIILSELISRGEIEVGIDAEGNVRLRARKDPGQVEWD